MSRCEACGIEEGTVFVTVRLDVVGRVNSRTKIVQFWLCPGCDRASQQVMANDREQRKRLARRLTDFPEFLSRWKDWRRRVFGDAWHEEIRKDAVQ